MKKRILSILAALCLCLTLLPTVVVAATPSGKGLTNSNISSNLNLSSGSYYLKENITLTSEFYITGTVTIDLNGYVLNVVGGEKTRQAVYVKTGGNLTIKDSNTSSQTHYFTVNDNGLWVWNKDVATTEYAVSGGVITGGHYSTGGAGVKVASGATFNMSGGNIVGCTAAGSSQAAGGGVSVHENSTFNMSGGSIIGCTADRMGGGVYVDHGASFTMSNNASVKYCRQTDGSSPYGGGGVATDGTFTVNGGEISNCSAAIDGGGVLITRDTAYTDSGSFTMTVGSISDCTATGYGGGVCVRSGTFTISGGTIASCTSTKTSEGGGIHLMDWFDNRDTRTMYANGGDIIAPVYNGGTILRNASGSNLGAYTLFRRTVTNRGTIDNNVYYYTVSFESNGGSAVATQKLLRGQKVSKPADPVKDYCAFDGWYKDSGRSTPFNFNSTPSGTDRNITVYAKWKTAQYSVSFDGNGADSGSMSKQGFTYNVSQKLTKNSFAKTGYTFAGWSTSRDGSKVYSDEQQVKNLSSTHNATVTLYALWSPDTYTISYNAGANGTGTIAAGSKTHGVDFTLSSDAFTRTGYVQIGWATTDGGEKVYDLGGTYTANTGVTLYPVWKDVTTPVIAGVADGETYCSAQTVTVSDNDGIASVTVNDEPVTPDASGKFTLSPAEGAQKIVVTDKAGNQTEITVTVNDGHSGGTATCQAQANCEICGEPYGEKDSTRHVGTLGAWQKDGNGHWKVYSCCPTVKGAEGAHDFEWQSEDGQYWQRCTVCEYETAKQDIPEITINGADRSCKTQNYTFTATFFEGAITPQYAYDNGFMGTGELDFDVVDGVYTAEVSSSITNEVTEFTVTAYAETPDGYTVTVRKTVAIQNEHTGGTATCTDKAECEICGEEYGEVNADNHVDEKEWSTKNDTQHEQTWKCCGAVVVALEDHEWEDGVCGECGYVCTHTGGDDDHTCDVCGKTFSDHTGGAADCAHKAVCDVCDEEYGEIDADKHAALTHVGAREATVEAEGNVEYWHCEGCDKYFSDKDGKNEIALADTVIAKLPKPDDTDVPAVPDDVETPDEIETPDDIETPDEIDVPANDDDTPQTGDGSRVDIWVALLVISGCLLTATGICGKKRKR